MHSAVTDLLLQEKILELSAINSQLVSRIN